MPSRQTQEKISAKTGLDVDEVQMWFHTRRAKDKEIMEGYRETSPSAEAQANGGVGSPGNTCSSSGADHSEQQGRTQRHSMQAQGRSEHASKSVNMHYPHPSWRLCTL